MVKVVVCGAAGGIGQPLSLLLKQSDLISHLALYDIVNAIGVAADLSHINTASKVTGHVGAGALAEALQGAHTVVIPAGVPRRPGMTRDDLVFGVTTLDVVRSSRFVHEVKPQFEPHEIANRITVVGGHSGATIVPILSKINQQPHNQSISFTPEEIKTLTHRIQFGGDEVVKAKDGAGSATLSMAYAGARFTLSLLEASVRGKRGVVESTFVHLPGNPGSEWNQRFTGLDYFAQDVELGPDGVAKVLALPELSTEEQALVKIAINELKGNVTKGVKFITEPQPGAPPAAKL
ncbi:hypothetical protein BX616_010841 [Lobosporangium transversale]|nr:hypothetical protein BX616_010841 [Lobosporangium transversale]